MLWVVKYKSPLTLPLDHVRFRAKSCDLGGAGLLPDRERGNELSGLTMKFEKAIWIMRA
jgi:hypothetical protein